MVAQTQSPNQDENDVLHQAHMLDTLTKMPGWKVFVDMLQNRVDMEATQAMSVSRSMDEMIAKEFAKGTFNGLRLAMTLPERTVQMAQDIRRQYGIGSLGGTSAKVDVDDESADGPASVPSHPIGHAP